MNVSTDSKHTAKCELMCSSVTSDNNADRNQGAEQSKTITEVPYSERYSHYYEHNRTDKSRSYCETSIFIIVWLFITTTMLNQGICRNHSLAKVIFFSTILFIV